ncbi:hypothetical protein D3C84_973350 [compost metagenome]
MGLDVVHVPWIKAAIGTLVGRVLGLFARRKHRAFGAVGGHAQGAQHAQGTALRRQGLGNRFDQKGHRTFARHNAVGVLAERFHPRAGGKSRQLRETQEQRGWQHGVEGHDNRVVRLAAVDQRLGHIQGIGERTARGVYR